MPTSFSDYILANDPTELRRLKKKRESQREQAEQYALESDAVSAHLDRQNQELALRGVAPPKEDPSVLSKTFDILSRPNYAVANLFRSQTDPNVENTGGDLGGSIRVVGREFWEGLSGKDKTTFSDVLDDVGVENKWVREPLGFALDVGLDPTTYASFGGNVLAKGALRGAATVNDLKTATRAGRRLAATQAAGRASQKVISEGSSHVGKKVTQQLVDDFVAKGLGQTSEHLTASGAKRLSHRMLQDEAYEAGLKAQDDVLASTQGTFGLKFAGKPVPLLQSKSLYTIGEKIDDVWKGTSAGKFGQSKVGGAIGTVGRGVNQTFKTTHLFPGPLRTLKREAEGFSAAQFEEVERGIRNTFRGVSKEDQRLIADAIESGTKLEGDLGKLQEEALTWRDSITEIELSKGLLNEDEVLDNYLYHFYRADDRVNVNKFKTARKKAQNPNKNSKYSTIKTLEMADKAGLKPIREIGDILLLRAGKSYKEQGRAAFADAVSREFGVKMGKEGASVGAKLDLTKAKSKYIKGVDENGLSVYLPKEVNEAIKHMDGLYDNIDETNNLLRIIDKGLAHWKFGATAINPGHHIRNAVGDMFLNTLDGVSNPLRYKQSADVLLKNSKAKIKVGTGTLNAEELKRYYMLKGAKSSYTRVEIGARKFKPTEKIRQWAENREDWTRMAHFIDALKKEAEGIDPKNLIAMDKAASRAATRVRKFNIDYNDLTDTEKKVFKRVVPFYTWMRKNVPLQLEGLALTPGRQAVVPKSLRMLQGLLGAESDQEYPTTGGMETVPKWIRDMSGINILGEGQGRNGVYLDPSRLAPSMDALSLIGEPTGKLLQGDVEGSVEAGSAEALNMLNPALRTMVEFGTDTNTFTGGQRQDTGIGGYLSQQLPVARLLSGINIDGVTSGNGQSDKWDITNYLTGASFKEIGEPQKAGELRRQQDIIENTLEKSGGIAADILQRRPLDVREYDEPGQAEARLRNTVIDLETGGQSLALLDYYERKKKKENEDRIRQILNGYTESFYGV